MVDLTAIQGAITGLQSASNIAKAFIGLRDEALIQGKVIELQTVILAAQSSALAAQSNQSALLDDVRTLKEKMASLEAWDTEKKKYELKPIGYGALAYMLRPEARGTEPPHWVCARCYSDGKIHLIQNTWPKKGYSANSSMGWFCQSCHTEVNPNNPPPQWID